ncbi:Integrase, catalytic region [Paracoccus aminovorans]|nr:Integrase, catalytic region [Paracoccus aminovorans]
MQTAYGWPVGEGRPPVEVVVSFIDAHRGVHGVEPICGVLPIAPSTYYSHLAKRADPTRQSDRARRDEALRPEILRVFEENWHVYGVRKVWRQLGREGFDVARCTVARLMKGMGIQGIIRGKPHRTTVPDKKAPYPLDKVNRQFRIVAESLQPGVRLRMWRGVMTCSPTIFRNGVAVRGADCWLCRPISWRSPSCPAPFPRSRFLCRWRLTILLIDGPGRPCLWRLIGTGTGS